MGLEQLPETWRVPLTLPLHSPHPQGVFFPIPSVGKAMELFLLFGPSLWNHVDLKVHFGQNSRIPSLPAKQSEKSTGR